MNETTCSIETLAAALAFARNANDMTKVMLVMTQADAQGIVIADLITLADTMKV